MKEQPDNTDSKKVSDAITGIAEAMREDKSKEGFWESVKEKTSSLGKAIENKIGKFWAGVIIGTLNGILLAYIYGAVKTDKICPEAIKEKFKKLAGSSDYTLGEYLLTALNTVLFSLGVTSLIVYFNLF